MPKKIEATFYGGSLDGLTDEVEKLRPEIVLGERTEAQNGKVEVVKGERYKLLCLRDNGGDYALNEEKKGTGSSPNGAAGPKSGKVEG